MALIIDKQKTMLSHQYFQYVQVIFIEIDGMCNQLIQKVNLNNLEKGGEN